MTLLRDTWLIFGRSVQKLLRNPIWIAVSLFSPLCFFLLFAPLLEKLTNVPGFGAGSALTVFTPGLLIMLAMYGCAFVGFGLIDDIRSGVIERFRVTPINRTALLLGRCMRDIVSLLAQSLFILVLAKIFGLSAPLLGTILSLGFVALVAFAVSLASYNTAMILQSEDSMSATLNFFIQPLQLLAGFMLPLTLAPGWLQKIAWLNPLSHVVYATRALFIGAYTDPAVLWGFVVISLVALAAFYWSANLFKKSTE